MSRNAEKNGQVASELCKFGTCVSMPGDVRKIEDCKRVVKDTVDKFGSVNVLVNGAAGNFLAQASKISSNGVKTVLEIDTLGTFNMCQSVFNGYMKEHGGSIINISAALHWMGTVYQVHSSAAKAGVDAITKTLAAEWGPYKVRVNGLVPGLIENTEGFARLGDLSNLNSKERSNTAFGEKRQQSSQLDQMKMKIPLQRFGTG